jgi:hypothetical protein
MGTSYTGDAEALPRPRPAGGVRPPSEALCSARLAAGRRGEPAGGRLREVPLQASTESCYRPPPGPHPRADTVGNVCGLLLPATIPSRKPPQQASPGELPLLLVAFLKIGFFFPVELEV